MPGESSDLSPGPPSHWPVVDRRRGSTSSRDHAFLFSGLWLLFGWKHFPAIVVIHPHRGLGLEHQRSDVHVKIWNVKPSQPAPSAGPWVGLGPPGGTHSPLLPSAGESPVPWLKAWMFDHIPQTDPRFPRVEMSNRHLSSSSPSSGPWFSGNGREFEETRSKESIKNNYNQEPGGRGNGLRSLINRILLTC